MINSFFIVMMEQWHIEQIDVIKYMHEKEIPLMFKLQRTALHIVDYMEGIFSILDPSAQLYRTWERAGTNENPWYDIKVQLSTLRKFFLPFSWHIVMKPNFHKNEKQEKFKNLCMSGMWRFKINFSVCYHPGRPMYKPACSLVLCSIIDFYVFEKPARESWKFPWTCLLWTLILKGTAS